MTAELLYSAHFKRKIENSPQRRDAGRIHTHIELDAFMRSILSIEVVPPHPSTLAVTFIKA